MLKAAVSSKHRPCVHFYHTNLKSPPDSPWNQWRAVLRACRTVWRWQQTCGHWRRHCSRRSASWRFSRLHPRNPQRCGCHRVTGRGRSPRVSAPAGSGPGRRDRCWVKSGNKSELEGVFFKVATNRNSHLFSFSDIPDEHLFTCSHSNVAALLSPSEGHICDVGFLATDYSKHSAGGVAQVLLGQPHDPAAWESCFTRTQERLWSITRSVEEKINTVVFLNSFHRRHFIHSS